MRVQICALPYYSGQENTNLLIHANLALQILRLAVGSYLYYRVELICVNRKESRARQRWDYLKCPPRGQRGQERRKGGRVSPFSDIIQNQSKSSFSRFFPFLSLLNYFRLKLIFPDPKIDYKSLFSSYFNPEGCSQMGIKNNCCNS